MKKERTEDDQETLEMMVTAARKSAQAASSPLAKEVCTILAEVLEAKLPLWIIVAERPDGGLQRVEISAPNEVAALLVFQASYPEWKAERVSRSAPQ